MMPPELTQIIPAISTILMVYLFMQMPLGWIDKMKTANDQTLELLVTMRGKNKKRSIDEYLEDGQIESSGENWSFYLDNLYFWLGKLLPLLISLFFLVVFAVLLIGLALWLKIGDLTLLSFVPIPILSAALLLMCFTIVKHKRFAYVTWN